MSQTPLRFLLRRFRLRRPRLPLARRPAWTCPALRCPESCWFAPRRSGLPRVALSALAALLAGLCAGCASAPEAPPQLPAAPLTFRETPPGWTVATPADSQPRGEWWRVFGDAELDRLEARAQAGSTSIALALARLTQARALARGATAERLPQAGLRSATTRQGGGLINAAGGDGTLITATADLSYELDLFGRLRGVADAAALDAEGAAALLHSVRLLVQAEVAQTYFKLRALDAERAVLRAQHAAQAEAVRVAEARLRIGSIAELDLARLRAELAGGMAEGAALERQRARLEHALAMAVGATASEFALTESDWPATAALPPRIPPGVPSTMLGRRPDVAASLRAIEAAQARIGVARAAWFPAVALTGNAGTATPELASLFSLPMRAWGLGALVALPLFDGGRRDAALEVARAQFEAAMVAYREAVLAAVRDVEDQLAALRTLADEADAQERAAGAAARAVTLSEARVANGLASQLELLDARRVLLRAQRQAVQVRAARFQSTVGLVRALGGGWQAAVTAGTGAS